MKILLAHNYYQQSGGEDGVFAAEKELLLRKGHEVVSYIDNNERITTLSKISAAKETIWSSFSYSQVRLIIRETKPDIVHFHNSFLLISPAAYYACKDEGVTIIKTLHNYRLLCPNALFYRNDSLCEDCLGKSFPWPGILHACYRNSRSQTMGVATMLALHRLRGTWQKQIDQYIVLSQFAYRKFILGGLPQNKITVKPNFHVDQGISTQLRRYVLFVGRLTLEKGIRTLLQAWNLCRLPLKIIGEGPLKDDFKNEINKFPNPTIEFLGNKPHDTVLNYMRNAKCLIFPSNCYENFPLTILEAFACGVPVIASRIGSLIEIIQDGETGLFFNPGDALNLAYKITWLWDHPEEAKRMGLRARQEYELKYTPEKNYEMLMDIYQQALSSKA